ncbi:hypothetical protein [Tenacibaculum sp. 47A_GOM-205m]|uniref:hypothetical protein n=1 Tax=Tenacibaculum sp. 47A_GOM-205m TaxID=1380384 RepID=UPI0012DFBB3C|nr:hypothetical protein [Tenacibaculum sp. 47A_GOM-205m]
MKKLLVLFLFVGFVCNTHALNKVISNSVNDTEQIIFPENPQEVTASVADFNCDIQNVAVYLSMEKIIMQNGFELKLPKLPGEFQGKALADISIDPHGIPPFILELKEQQIEMLNTLNSFVPSLDDLVRKDLINKGYEVELESGIEAFAKSDRCLIVSNHQTRPYEHTLLVDDNPICMWRYPDNSIKNEADKFTATYLEFTEL